MCNENNIPKTHRQTKISECLGDTMALIHGLHNLLNTKLFFSKSSAN